MSFNESALVKYDRQIISVSRGYPAHVEFNFEKVWNFKRSIGKDFDPELLAFYHVHPEGFLNYSSLDVECLKGFNAAFGYPVYFGIITFKDSKWGYDWEIDPKPFNHVAFRLKNGDMVQVPDFEVRLDYFESLILKGVSYAEEVA